MLSVENVPPQKKEKKNSSYVLIQTQHQSISQSSSSTWRNRDGEADIYLKLTATQRSKLDAVQQ